MKAILFAGLLLGSLGFAAQSSSYPTAARDYVSNWEAHHAQLVSRGCRVFYVQPRPEFGNSYEIGYECPLPPGAGTLYPYVPDTATPAIELPTTGYDLTTDCLGNRPMHSFICDHGGWRPWRTGDPGPPR